MPRPPKYNEARAARIIEGLKLGMTRRAASSLGNIDEDTFWRWLKKYAGFAVLVAIAEQEAEARYTQVIAQAAMKEKDWRAALEWLKRRKKDDWSERQETTGKDGGSIQIESTGTAGARLEEKLAAAVRRRKTEPDSIPHAG